MTAMHKIKAFVTRAALPVEPVAWPTNLAWRVQLKRYGDNKNLQWLENVCPARKGRVFAMPFRNWRSTYWSLLGKDIKKIPFMPTQVVQLSDAALVGDMDMVDTLIFLHQGRDQVSSALEHQIAEYNESLITYAKFKRDPHVFSRPEIMALPNQIQFLPQRVVLTQQNDDDEAMPTPLLGIKSKPVK